MTGFDWRGPTGQVPGTRVKFCGFTRPEDARSAAGMGIDALGVVFAESPRCMDVPGARAVFTAAGSGLARVGVFADQTLDVVMEAVELCDLDWVQLSGSEPPEYAARIPVNVLKAVHVAGADDLVAHTDYPAAGFLLDAPVTDGLKGGRGVVFDWAVADELPWPRERVVVAGGLSHENVAEVVGRIRPGAVDVASGIESAPGIKDPLLMEAFLIALAAVPITPAAGEDDDD